MPIISIVFFSKLSIILSGGNKWVIQEVMLELVKQKQEITLEVIHNLQEVILQMLELTQDLNKHYIWKKEGNPFPFVCS